MRRDIGPVNILLILLMFILTAPVGCAEPSANQPPEAYFTVSPSSGQSPLTVEFDASGSSDPDGTIVSYSWNFGDGKTGSGEKVSHTYRNFEGTFNAVLTVTDDSGLSGDYSTKITVASNRILSVTISSDPFSVSPDEPSKIKVIVTGKDGSFINGAKVTLSTTPGGKLEPESGSTDSSGEFHSTFTAPAEGSYRISTTVKKDSYSLGSGNAMVKASRKSTFLVEIVSSAASIEPGGSSAIKVTVKGSDGAPVPDAIVKLIPDQNATVSPDSGQTDPGGQFTSTFTGSAEGTFTVKAIVKKKGFSEGSGEVTVAIKSGNVFSILIIAIILIIIFGVAGLEFLDKGKLQLIPLLTSIPCNGTSTLPLKVQFVDPSGKPRKQRTDRIIEIISTSGTVQNVTIQAGKESAEAILTSSHVCGHVTVAARSGLQKARAYVEFAGHMAGIVLEVSPVTIPADGISISSIVIKIKDDKGNFMTSLNDMTVELTTTLGTITSPVTIPPGTLSGISILTAGKNSGTAVVSARMGDLKGEKKVVFEVLPERYCMNCGDPMKRDATVCPTCKKPPPSNAEIKQCYSCSTVIPAPAEFCDRCGAKQPAND